MDYESIQVEDYTKNGKCSSCGSCCSGILPLSQKEIQEIHKYIKKNNIKQQHNPIAILSPKGIDGTCPFRNETEKKCMIYEIRPMICRVFQCNNTRQKMIKDRNKLHTRCVVFMRKEFYGDTTLLDAMNNSMKL